jgi:hypothetical protein
MEPSARFLAVREVVNREDPVGLARAPLRTSTIPEAEDLIKCRGL